MAAGTDLSWGAIDAMASALKINPVEVEGPEEVAYDLPQPERWVMRGRGLGGGWAHHRLVCSPLLLTAQATKSHVYIYITSKQATACADVHDGLAEHGWRAAQPGGREPALLP